MPFIVGKVANWTQLSFAGIMEAIGKKKHIPKKRNFPIQENWPKRTPWWVKY